MSTFNPPAPLNPLTKARSVDINSLTDSVATAFAALPSDSDLNNGTVNFGIDSGTANAYIVTLPRVPTGYVDGLRVVFTPLNSNTGASTVNVNGLGVKAIRLQDNTATEPGTLVAGIPKTLIYGLALGNFFVEANSVTSAMTAAAAAAASAGAAAGSASAAAGSAGAAATSASNAQASAVDAADSAAAAATSAVNAATSLTATSATDNTIATGTLSYVTQAGKAFSVGADIKAVDQTNSGNAVYGTVAAYAGTALQILVTSITGSGLVSDWNISIVGQRGVAGPTGGISGGLLTGALDEKKGTDLASAATIDPWVTGGNSMNLTGSATIGALANAPQAGARRTLIATGSPTFTSTANMVVDGGTVTVAPGDRIDILADTVTLTRLTVHRADVSPTPSPYRVAEYLGASQVWTCKVTGPHRITLCAASGSGGVARATGAGCASASGGSSGGIVVKHFYAIAGNTYVLSLGAAGAGITIAASTVATAVAGNNAVDSSFTGNGLSLMAGGGKGGNATTSGSVQALTVALGAVGGSASGGDYNFPGAGSGVATCNVTGPAATGGVGSSYKGKAYPSGVATLAIGAPTILAVASGGAGVGAKSGDATATGPGAVATGGGGAVGASLDVTSSGTSAGGAGETLPIFTVPLSLTSAGTTGVIGIAGNTPAGAGGGGGASAAIIADEGGGNTTSSTGGLLAGSGGAARRFNTGGAGSEVKSASCGPGGSSGGVAVMTTASVSLQLVTSNGGVGFAIIESA